MNFETEPVTSAEAPESKAVDVSIGAAPHEQPVNTPAVPFSNRITRVLDNHVIASAPQEEKELACPREQEPNSAYESLSSVLTKELSPDVYTQDTDAYEVILAALLEAYVPSTPGKVTLVHLLAADLTQLKLVRDMLYELHRPPAFEGHRVEFFQLILTRHQALVITERILARDAKHTLGCTRAEAGRLASHLSERVKYIQSEFQVIKGKPENMEKKVSEAMAEHMNNINNIWNAIVAYKEQLIDREHLAAVLCGEATPGAAERHALQMLLIDWAQLIRSWVANQQRREDRVREQFRERRGHVNECPKLLNVPNKTVRDLEKAILQKIKLLDHA